MRLHEPPRTRAGLLALALSGPLAGFFAVVVLLVLWALGRDVQAEGIGLSTPMIFHAVFWAVQGGPSPSPSTGEPLAFAAWNGCLLTAMNLAPIGQLDGGHAAAALFPRWTGWIGAAVTLTLLILAFWWPGWGLWLLSIYLLGAWRPVQVRPSDLPPRLAVVAGALHVATFVVVFTPVPVPVSQLWWIYSQG
jgi:membrane-associated protease RseP (regulator of RpoE activity)